MLKVRINRFIDDYKVLLANCYAYSAGKSTFFCINVFLLHISITKNTKQQVFSVVLAMKNAYEKADLATLSDIMASFFFPAELVLWVTNAMPNRQFLLGLDCIQTNNDISPRMHLKSHAG